MPDNDGLASPKGISLTSSSLLPVFDLKPFETSTTTQQVRDIFSLTPPAASSGSAENTPKGQLPDHLKVVGVLIGHPSQIIIEDSSSNNTYFIDEGQAQDGIKIVKALRNQITINYQGQDISVPVTKN